MAVESDSVGRENLADVFHWRRAEEGRTPKEADDEIHLRRSWACDSDAQ
jgi:hypothetical protein